MINKVILMGRICNDLDLKTTPNGTEVTQFRLAIERNYKDANGERQADFIGCVAWRNTAKFICDYFGKGRMILVEGALQTRSYKDKDNKLVYVTEVVIDSVSFTGEKPAVKTETSQSAPGLETQHYVPPQQPMYTADDFTKATDDEYPF